MCHSCMIVIYKLPTLKILISNGIFGVSYILSKKCIIIDHILALLVKNKQTIQIYIMYSDFYMAVTFNVQSSQSQTFYYFSINNIMTFVQFMFVISVSNSILDSLQMYFMFKVTKD